MTDLVLQSERWADTWRPAALWVAAVANTKATRRSYAGAVGQFAALVRCPLAEVCEDHVIAFKLSMVDRDLQPRTVRHRLIVVGAFFRWAIGRGYHAGPNPAGRVPMPKPRRSAFAVALDGRQVDQLLEAAAGDRDRAILAVMADSGLRAAEVVSLAESDILTDAGRPVVRVRAGKGGHGRKVPTTRRAVDLVAIYLGGKTRQGGSARSLFQDLAGNGRPISTRQIDRIVRRAASAAALGDLSPHDLRRTFATRALLAGAPAPVVQAAMGHSDLTTTAAYYVPGGRGPSVAEFLQGDGD